jgi:formylglycine-generating enzyme required for sulfatase activity
MPRFECTLRLAAMALVLGAATLAAQTASVGPYGMQFVQIPSGEFTMGCSPGDAECAASESPAHPVRITKGFQIGRHEVTQEQWEAVMGSNPSYSRGAARPVERVTWDEIQEFLRRLNARGDGFRYRLPAEAEWEYAARAGSADRYAGAGALPDVAWNYANSGGETHPVGQKQPNAWGLYDTLGNVYEWCQDWFEETYYSVSPQDDPAGPASGTYRVVRGGSWVLNSWFVRVSSRLRFPPADGYAGIGFRCVREAAPAATCALACLASGPASGTTGAAVSFTASATLAGCPGTPAYSWAFGDGGGSAQQNPSYAYRQSGSYTWTMTVSAAGAAACARSGSIQISTGCASPSITAQPAGQTVAAGSTAALTVTASGSAPLSYQWYEGASGDTTKPVGTNSPTFRAPAPAAATTYWVRVTNVCGQVDSAAAAVSVAAIAGPNGIQFMQIQPGEFSMGCSTGDAECYGDESPAHRVRITRGFQIGQYEVTQDQWQAVMGASPSWFQGATLPVEMVSWDDVQEFLGRLNARNDGFRYRLPTEAEWEYAARAGTTGRYAGAGALGDVAWYSGNSTRPVGQKRPNAWGLHDMLGNVYEWCQDWYGSYSSNAADNPTGPASGSFRVLRGGSWLFITGLTRVSYRDRSVPGERQGSIGFRCVREAAASSCAGPAITTQPAGQTIAAGSTADLTVTASGSAPLSYQWYEGVKGTTSKPVGTNSVTFGTPSLTAAATYWVRVTNACGQADSAAATVSVTTSAGATIEFAQVPPGEFMMGCSPGDGECQSVENPAHRVRITRGFQIGKYEVTQQQWQAVMGSNPSRSQGATLPLEQVSWDDVQGFLRRLNARNDGFLYRLPTEAEWEYAARAGTTDKYAGASALGDVAWFSGNSGSQTRPVGQKRPNAWGLYDMLGNVWEWCQDWYGTSYYPTSPQADPAGPSSGQNRVFRGGSWGVAAAVARVSGRGWTEPGDRGAGIGFRCVREMAVSACAGPAILAQPAGQTIATGSTADISVTASGSAPLSYQWYEGVKGITTKPVGTNSATLRTPALTAPATYWVRVTNPCGQADSAVAAVSVATSIGPSGMQFVQIQPGEFTMGCSPDDGECYNDESPAHRVRITKAFQIGKYEVTQEQWQAAMGSNPSRFQDTTLPVETVSWDDVQEFLRRLNSGGDGYLYRLPTEAEWEYAARAGTTGRYAGAGTLDEAAWYSGNSTRPVGQKQPNAWGVYDMLGNVWEWCQDWYDAASYYPSSQQADPTGPAAGAYRILRGGSWVFVAGTARVSYRNRDLPGYRNNNAGFRCVREAIP